MKKLFLLLLFPLFVYSQPLYPTTPNYKDGRLLVDVGTNVTFTGTVTNTIFTDVNVTNTINAAVNTQTNVGGFTQIGEQIVYVDTTATGVAANDVLATAISISNASRTTGGSAILQTLTWTHGGTLADPSVKPDINLLVCVDTITWPTTNAAANLVQSDLTKIAGVVQFTTGDFVQIGTNWIATKTGLGIGFTPLATTLYIYPVSKTAITNSNPSRISWTILQD